MLEMFSRKLRVCSRVATALQESTSKYETNSISMILRPIADPFPRTWQPQPEQQNKKSPIPVSSDLQATAHAAQNVVVSLLAKGRAR